MNERIVYTKSDGSAAIVIPAEELITLTIEDSVEKIANAITKIESEAEVMARVITEAKERIEAINNTIIEADDNKTIAVLELELATINDAIAIAEDTAITISKNLVIAKGKTPITRDEIIQLIMEKDVPDDAINIRLITINDLPSDRLFRDAWDDSNPENFIGVNFSKAQGIAHNIRRINREEKMKPLDKEENFASTSQARKDEILTEKQAILEVNANVQIDIDSCIDEATLRTVLSTASIA